MTTTEPTPSPRATGGWARTTVVALGLWGLLHVVGGAALMIGAADDRAAALRSLGSAAPVDAIPADPGPVTEAVIGFHGMNILWAGLAVTGLTVAWSWRRFPRGVPTSLLIAAAADVGLVVYLLIPGLMRTSEGMWGPLLLLGATAGAVLAKRQANQVMSR